MNFQTAFNMQAILCLTSVKFAYFYHLISAGGKSVRGKKLYAAYFDNEI